MADKTFLKVLLSPEGERAVRELAGRRQDPRPLRAFVEDELYPAAVSAAGVCFRYVLGWDPPTGLQSGRVFLPWGFVLALELEPVGHYHPGPSR